MVLKLKYFERIMICAKILKHDTYNDNTTLENIRDGDF